MRRASQSTRYDLVVLNFAITVIINRVHKLFQLLRCGIRSQGLEDGGELLGRYISVSTLVKESETLLPFPLWILATCLEMRIGGRVERRRRAKVPLCGAEKQC